MNQKSSVAQTPKSVREVLTSDKAARLKKTLRTENTIWGDTVGVFRKVVETRHALGTSYMRQLADRAEGGTGAPKAKPKPKAKTAKKPVAAVRKKAG